MKEEGLDLRMLLGIGMRYWYLFALIFPLAIFGTKFFLDTKEPVYQLNTLLLIKSDEKSGELNEEAILQELGVVRPPKNLDNEISILSSTPLMKEVVQSLELNYEYVEIGKFKKRHLYKQSPVRVTNWQPNPGYEWFYGEVHVRKSGYYTLDFELDEKEFTIDGEFGKVLTFPYGKIILTYNGMNELDGPIGIRISPPVGKALEMGEILKVEPEGKKSSIINLSYKDVSPQRAKDVLQKLIEVYNTKGIEKENQTYLNTINLLNERINLITQELNEAEQNVQTYKQRHNMMELNSEGSLLINELADYNKEIQHKDVQLSILKSIEDSLINNKDDFEFVPTNKELDNLTLTGQLESFNNLLAEKERLREDVRASHPDLQLVEKQIQNLRGSIIENIQSMKGDLALSRNATENQREYFENRLQSLPRRERELIGIERQKNVKENLYLYLLKEREESAISMAITMAKGEVVEPPEIPEHPVSPNPKVAWVTGGFLGLALPSGIIFLLILLNDKIESEEDIERHTKLPVAGVVAQSSKNKGLVVKENSRTAAAEMFRMIRANLAYITPDKVLKTLLVTSTISGEGKSFIALNLGVIQAMSGKKVALLNMDLRNPNEGVAINNNTKKKKKGIVNFLVDPTVTIQQITSKSDVHENLDILSCGPNPPNPGELILSRRLRVLIDELREMYDLIIVDSPPVGMVADALQMNDMVDATLYVVRSGYTPKSYFKFINNLSEKAKLPRPFIVLNAVPLKRYGAYYGAYGLDYHYVKSNGYFEQEA